MASRGGVFRLSILVLAACAAGMAGTVVGWYNGDPVDQFTVGLTNGIDTGGYPAANVYEDFIVPAGGWTVAGVFAYDFLDFAPGTQAEWAIRSGMSSGNGGTLIASGTDTATYTSTGESGAGSTIYKVEVDNLSVALAPGKYWLTLAPVDCGSGCDSAVDDTIGTNAIGNPPGNDLDNFDNFPAVGLNYVFDPTSGGSARDWSLGVLIQTGLPTPEPGALSLFAAGLFAAGLLKKRSLRPHR